MKKGDGEANGTPSGVFPSKLERKNAGIFCFANLLTY